MPSAISWSGSRIPFDPFAGITRGGVLMQEDARRSHPASPRRITIRLPRIARECDIAVSALLVFHIPLEGH